MEEDRSTLFELARQLLRCGDAALLDCALEQIAVQVQAHDEVAAELVRDLAATGVADTLRDALEQDRLDRWVVQTCTAREEELLCAQLMRWLGKGSCGDDDPARLVQLAPLPEGPAEHIAPRLHAWARAHGVADLLDRRAGELLPGRPESSAAFSLLACCLGQAKERGASLLAADTLEREARAYLREQAAQRAAIGARAALWGRPLADASLRPLASRLRALLPVELDPAQLAAVRFVPARPVSVDARTGTSEAMSLDPSGAPFAVRLHLSGYEHRAPASHCAHCPATPCLHVQALAARLLDALHEGDDRLFPSLQQIGTRPSWQRFVAALQDDGQAPGAEPSEASAAHGQLTFRVRFEDGAISVGVLHRKVGVGGRLSSGKLIAPQAALRARACSERDRPLLEALALGRRTLTAQHTRADLAVLRALVEHPRVSFGDAEIELRVAEQNPHVELVEQAQGLLPRVSLAGTPVAPREHRTREAYLFRHDPALQTLWFAPLTPPLRRLLAALEHFHGLLPPESFGALSRWIAGLRQVARVTVPAALQGEELPAPRKLLLRIAPDRDEGIELALSSRPLPLGALWPPGQGEALTHGLVEGRQVFARRDLDWERLAAMQVLEALGLRDALRVRPFAYHIASRQAALELLARAAELADRLDLEWSEPARKLSLQSSLRSEHLAIRVFKAGGQWLSIEGGARSADAHVPANLLLDAARRGERYVRVAEGSYAEITRELFERLQRAQLCVGELDLCSDAAVALPTAAIGYFHAALGDRSEAATPDARAWLARAVAHDGSDPPPLAPRWQQVLRAYQAEGARYLLSMSRWAPGACLADEMGLGKTVQAIALLDARASLGPALVLAPTSVVPNWAAELARFAPELDARAYHGLARDGALRALRAGSVVVTSYELLLRDAAHFTELHFATQVLDEAHLIKNARTRRARAAAAVNADFRLALSGTPVENRLGDLWSLFHVVAPGLLGDWNRFRALFAVPIERYGDAERAEALRALVAPFILRRTKDAVASELPERTEVVHRVALSDPERALYQAAEHEVRRRLGERGADDGPRTVRILAELTRLRQLACHPRLVLQEPEAESTKLAVLLRLLDDILPRGHRALLFSQFTRHLALVREALDARGLRYLYLDGSTPAGQRSALVERFQAGEAPLFLISLKAGGTGLNLTAADYVVHLDPWWNPAAQDQASDRAHRIGQHRPVTVIKLVAEDTIEEKVLLLHGHKRELADAVLRGDGAPGKLDLQALESLLP